MANSRRAPLSPIGERSNTVMVIAMISALMGPGRPGGAVPNNLVAFSAIAARNRAHFAKIVRPHCRALAVAYVLATMAAQRDPR